MITFYNIVYSKLIWGKDKQHRILLLKIKNIFFNHFNCLEGLYIICNYEIILLHYRNFGSLKVKK